MSTLRTTNIKHETSSNNNITLDGSGGVIIAGVTTVSAGSTSAPSISPTGDSNTGIFFPSPDTIAFAEGGTEVLRVNSNGYVGIGTTNPTAKLEVNGKLSVITPTTLSTTLDTGLSFVNTSTKTYPTTSSFTVYPGLRQQLELGNSSVVDTTTPGGFNFVIGLNNTLTKSAGNTQDIERLYFGGFFQSFAWTDANTCKQYISINDTFNYSGIDANGRTSSYLSANTINLNPPTGGTQTIDNLYGTSGITYTSQGTTTINVTNSSNLSPSLSFFNSTAGTKTINITNHTFLGTSSWGVQGTTGTLSATITNLYGLRLTAPIGSTGLTVTNNWGISQEWASAKNYFAGSVGIGNTNPQAALHVSSGNIKVDNGYGIDFSATANSSGTMTSELLNDYEEGTWTPTLPDGGTVSSILGAFYTKIGRIVTAYLYISTSSIPSNSTEFRISGLPYTSLTGNHYSTGQIGYCGTFNLGPWRPLVVNGGSHIYFHRIDGSNATLLNSGATGLTEILISVWYYAA